MSNNNTINGTPGVKRVVPKDLPYALAVKVTGRNLSGVSYLVSLEAERRGVPMAASGFFDTDGSLAGITVVDLSTNDETDLKPGEYVVLPPHSLENIVFSADVYEATFSVL